MINKAIYSFWTKPMNDTFFGFNSEKVLIECMALSVGLCRRYFSKVELVTDLKGKELLIDKYNLPFTSVSIELEEGLSGIDEKHWSIGKIYACKIQKEPFIHIDNDVIWVKRPPDYLLKADACFQSIESGYAQYQFLLNHAINNYKDKPDYKWDENIAYCCGIVGFNKLEHLETWWQDSLEYIDYIDSYFKEEYDTWHELPCLIFEQFYIKNICNINNYDVQFVHEEYVNKETAVRLGYTHLISTSKRNKYVEELINTNYKLFKENKETYKRN